MWNITCALYSITTAAGFTDLEQLQNKLNTNLNARNDNLQTWIYI